jgi:L-2-hydroxyglutarate oxidase LhgO
MFGRHDRRSSLPSVTTKLDGVCRLSRRRRRRARARFGPDVEWIDAIDHAVDPKRAESFYVAIRTYWPDLPDGALQPGYAGIRPKIVRPGTDFLIQTESAHGVPGLINLFGVESPGLTSRLAIAERIARLI